MSDDEFDEALVRAAFALAGRNGWGGVSVAEAARSAGLDLARARGRFPGRAALLLKLGRMADQAALAQTPTEGSVRDRLFYLVMERLDVLQDHRAGVLALLRRLPFEPGTALLLDTATRRSLRWLLEAAGVSTAGLRGELRAQGLYAVWLWAVRAWQNDETDDLSATMSAVDTALQRAGRLAEWLGERAPDGAEAAGTAPEPPPDAEPPAPEAPPPPVLGGSGPDVPIPGTPPP
ncbi:MAG: TetR family transcriptional regulator [Acetobacteraceae bacterium]|nr:TetR family transcriptional regulator [Acetobacteraceae bacterium]